MYSWGLGGVTVFICTERKVQMSHELQKYKVHQTHNFQHQISHLAF